MAELALPAAMVDLLDRLESHSPSLSELPPPADSWGTYFRRELRLRIMTAIGNCRSLRTIDLESREGNYDMYSVSDEEATALLNGLKHNPALETLALYGFKGFGTTEACKALAAAIVQPSCRLNFLDMRAVGLSVEGLGHISAALRDNSGSVLRKLFLDRNNMIGEAAGARHVANILTHSPALRKLGLFGIGMDDVGAVVIADAVAHSTTLERLDIGYDLQESPEQAAMLVPLLNALVQDCDISFRSEESPHSPCADPSFRSIPDRKVVYERTGNRSITKLCFEVSGLPGGSQDSAVEAELAEAVAGMLRRNSSLKRLWVSSFFVTRGLWALAHNKSSRTLKLVHENSLDEEELDPLLVKILHKCTNLRVLKLQFEKSYGASRFTKEFFQGLKHNKPSVEELVLDGWDGLDDDMFEDLIESLSTNTTLKTISIEGTSWEEQGKGERLEKALRGTRVELIPSQLRGLLEELESETPALQQLPSVDVWGSYFECDCGPLDGKCPHFEEWQWDLRLRLMTAIGKCRTLREIDLNPFPDVGYQVGSRTVREVEALALLSGLQDNPMLEELDLCCYMGFGATAACVRALSTVVERSYRSLDYLDLQNVGLSAEGLGEIAAALGCNGPSRLSGLALAGNDIGNAVGAQHLAGILSNAPWLRILIISDISMDEEGAVVIAQALAMHTTTITCLAMGDSVPRNPKQPMNIIPLLEALVWPATPCETPALVSRMKKWWLLQAMKNPSAAFNQSITRLKLCCPGGQEAVEAGLGEALACVLRSNRALNELSIDSFFVTRGLGALRESSSITKLRVHHSQHSNDDDMDPMLITILEECKTVRELILEFDKAFGPSRFTKAFFQGLQNNGSIKTLVLDGWKGLDDDMFHDLMRSLGPDSNNVLENISCRETSWNNYGKTGDIQNALIKNSRRIISSVGRQGKRCPTLPS